MANSSTAQDTDNNLATGQFDEAESHQSFLEALNAWRGVPSDKVAPKEKKVNFDDKKPGGFFAALDNKDKDWNVNCLPQFTEGGTQPE